jgi:hypothetical protein
VQVGGVTSPGTADRWQGLGRSRSWWFYNGPETQRPPLCSLALPTWRSPVKSRELHQDCRENNSR